ncbi:hypothetical protein CL617_00755 [archaeon]|nr:hypothetical protein [archaeon]|tara:strand:+ start:6243 stop:6884 length:642 start_codon:yes stop_codon:yes gene_type:complete
MKFSIIIPAYNEEKYIENTLKSIPKRDNIEIITVCNGCTDNTEKIASKYSEIILQKEKQVSKARNIGAISSKGSIIIFLDADTLLTQNTLKEIELSLKNSVIGTCKVKPDSQKLKYKIAMSFKNLLLWLPWTSGIIYCTKDVFKKTNGFNENLTKKEDKDFVRRAKHYGKFSIANTYIINSMRRFESRGIFKTAFFWIKETIKPTKKEYDSVR